MAREDGLIESLKAQMQMLETPRVRSVAGGDHATAVSRVANPFLALIDRINMLAAYQLSGRGSFGDMFATKEDLVCTGALFDEAVSHLNSATLSLADIAPRQPHEPPLPDSSQRIIPEAHV